MSSRRGSGGHELQDADLTHGLSAREEECRPEALAVEAVTQLPVDEAPNLPERKPLGEGGELFSHASREGLGRELEEALAQQLEDLGSAGQGLDQVGRFGLERARNLEPSALEQDAPTRLCEGEFTESAEDRGTRQLVVGIPNQDDLLPRFAKEGPERHAQVRALREPRQAAQAAPSSQRQRGLRDDLLELLLSPLFLADRPVDQGLASGQQGSQAGLVASDHVHRTPGPLRPAGVTDLWNLGPLTWGVAELYARCVPLIHPAAPAPRADDFGEHGRVKEACQDLANRALPARCLGARAARGGLA